MKPEDEAATADDGTPVTEAMLDAWDEAYSSGKIPQGYERDDGVRAMRELQQEMAGEAQRAGIMSEDEATDIVSDMRKARG